MSVIVHFTDFDDDFQASVRQLATAFSAMSKRHEELSSKENKVVADLAGIGMSKFSTVHLYNEMYNEL